MINLLDIDDLVTNFWHERQSGIATIHRVFYHTDDQLSLSALKEELKNELRTACVSFFNQNLPTKELTDYLFYVVNAYCKKHSKPVIKKQFHPICPACVFRLGIKNRLQENQGELICSVCCDCLVQATDLSDQLLFRTFAKHRKTGFSCPECQRFMPLPLDGKSIVCPYPTCIFAGTIAGLTKMRHPVIQALPSIVSPHPAGVEEMLSDDQPNAEERLGEGEELQEKVARLQEIIDSQCSAVPYCSSDATIRHKQYVYQAFSSLLHDRPEEMVGYLLQESDEYSGFQHQLFQRYISLLEASLPFMITVRKKQYRIETLLDERLVLFDGISVFHAEITTQQTIKNQTREFYIGGRKGSVARPYYIGKLLEVQETTGKSLMDAVLGYSFSKIRMCDDIKAGTKVIVSHLRVPPHYQLGGMVHVNRVRKKIMDKAKMVIV